MMLVAFLAAGIAVQAQEVSVRFSRESFTLGQVTLPYRKAEICHSVAEKPTLVLYLHGGSSRGSDNEAQLKENAVNVIYQYLLDRDIAATFIVPQCPTGGGWTSQNRKVVNELLKSYVNEGTVDADRIYVLGGSMGGTGTWCQLSYFPDFYAAAMPVAGNPTGMNAANVATTPVLTVMGTADAMMSIPDVETFMADVIIRSFIFFTLGDSSSRRRSTSALASESSATVFSIWSISLLETPLIPDVPSPTRSLSPISLTCRRRPSMRLRRCPPRDYQSRGLLPSKSEFLLSLT